MYFSRNHSVEKVGNGNMFMSALGPSCWKIAHRYKIGDVAHRRTTPTHDTESMHHSFICLKFPSVYKYFACEMVTSAHHAGPAAVDDEAVVAEAALEG